MEPWPVSIEYQHTGLSQRLSLHSVERLNLVVTPAAFRSIGDARLFYSMMMSLSAPAPAGMAPKALDATSEAPAPAKNMLSTMYRQDLHIRDSQFHWLWCIYLPIWFVLESNEPVPGCQAVLASLGCKGSVTSNVFSDCLAERPGSFEIVCPLQAGQSLWAEAVLLGRQRRRG